MPHARILYLHNSLLDASFNDFDDGSASQHLLKKTICKRDKRYLPTYLQKCILEEEIILLWTSCLAEFLQDFRIGPRSFSLENVLPIVTSSNANLSNLSENLSPISEQISIDLFMEMILSDYI